MKIFARTKNMSKKEWLEYRRYGVCGSDAPVILGLSKYRSVLQLWKDKTGQGRYLWKKQKVNMHTGDMSWRRPSEKSL